MATINVLDSVGSTVALEKPLTPGRVAAASSRPVVLSTEDKTALDLLHTDLIAATPAGTNVIGHVIVDTAPSTAVTNAGTFAVQSTNAAETTKVIGTVRNLGNAGAIIDFAGQNASSPANAFLIGGQFQTTPTTITAGNASPLQMDNAGNLLVNIKAGASSGAVAQGSTTSGQTGSLIQGAVTTGSPTYTTAQTSPLSLDTTGALRVNVTAGGAGGGIVTQATAANLNATVKITDGTNLGTVKAASTAPVATDTALVVSISPNSVNANVQGGAPVTVGAVVPTATANGATSSRVKAAASTNATSLKASAGQMYSIDVFNNAAYAVYLKLYNKASAPTVGTDTPVWTIPIAAGGGYSREFPRGKTFSTGIAYAITKLNADSDTTVVIADDLTGSIDWI